MKVRQRPFAGNIPCNLIRDLRIDHHRSSIKNRKDDRVRLCIIISITWDCSIVQSRSPLKGNVKLFPNNYQKKSIQTRHWISHYRPFPCWIQEITYRCFSQGKYSSAGEKRSDSRVRKARGHFINHARRGTNSSSRIAHQEIYNSTENGVNRTRWTPSTPSWKGKGHSQGDKNFPKQWLFKVSTLLKSFEVMMRYDAPIAITAA